MQKLIRVPKTKLWDEVNERFVDVPEISFRIVHSLVSISKWEAIWHKPFLEKEHSNAELVSYIECMCITPGIPSYVFGCLPTRVYKEIGDYLGDPMTATRITILEPQTGQREELTSELIYYYMFSFNIPKECEKWHINRLIKLIEVFNEKNKPPKKMSPEAQARMYRNLNAARRAKHHSKG